MTRISKLLGATALIASASLAIAAPAHATYVSNFTTNGYGDVGTSAGNYQAGTIDVTSATYIGLDEEAITSFRRSTGAPYAALASITASPSTLTVGLSNSGLISTGGPLTLTWTANGVNWTFTYDSTVLGDSATYTRNSSGGSNILTLYFIGTLTDNQPGTYPAQLAEFTDSFTESGGNASAIAEAGSFTTPYSVPEPVSLSILGLGVAGIAAVRRRRASV